MQKCVYYNVLRFLIESGSDCSTVVDHTTNDYEVDGLTPVTSLALASSLLLLFIKLECL